MLAFVGVIFLLLLNAFFVSSEFAMVRLRSTRLDARVAQGSRRARVAKHISGHLDAYLSACQVGITLASIGLGWIGEPFMERVLHPVFPLLGMESETLASSISFLIGYFLISFAHIVVGEMAPKSVAIRIPEGTAIWVAIPLRAFYLACYPFIWILNESALALVRLIGIEPVHGDGEPSFTEEEFRLLVARSASTGELTSKERILLENVLDFSDKQARQIMVPRTSVQYLNVDLPSGENLGEAARSGHTRLPLCAGDLDHLLGVLNVKDLVQELLERKPEDVSLRSLARPVLFVPETLSVDNLLLQFQQRKVHMAVVLDEYGGTSGIVTLENVLEELVGQIQDEFDQETPLLRRLGAGEWMAEGPCPLSALERVTGLDLPMEEATSVGGLVTALAGEIPPAGHEVILEPKGLAFRVEASDTRRIHRVRVRLIAQTTSEERPGATPQDGQPSP
jgi:CBS domain containing-hemolysin-like protein